MLKKTSETFRAKFPAAIPSCSMVKFGRLDNSKAWFKRRNLHAPNQILILVDSNEYVRLI